MNIIIFFIIKNNEIFIISFFFSTIIIFSYLKNYADSHYKNFNKQYTRLDYFYLFYYRCSNLVKFPSIMSNPLYQNMDNTLLNIFYFLLNTLLSISRFCRNCLLLYKYICNFATLLKIQPKAECFCCCQWLFFIVFCLSA